MATFTLFNTVRTKVFRGVFKFDADTFRILLTNTAPPATAAVKSDIAEISAGNGYTAGGPTTAMTLATINTTGAKVTAADTTITASGGTIGPFRYAVVYDDTAANDDLIGYADNGSSITLADTQAVKIDFDDANGLLTLG